MNLQRGDVVLCRVPMPSTGLAQFKVRPASIKEIVVYYSKCLTGIDTSFPKQ